GIHARTHRSWSSVVHRAEVKRRLLQGHDAWTTLFDDAVTRRGLPRRGCHDAVTPRSALNRTVATPRRLDGRSMPRQRLLRVMAHVRRRDGHDRQAVTMTGRGIEFRATDLPIDHFGDGLPDRLE